MKDKLKKKENENLPRDSLRESFLHNSNSSNKNNRRRGRGCARSRQEPSWQRSWQIFHRHHRALHLLRPFRGF